MYCGITREKGELHFIRLIGFDIYGNEQELLGCIMLMVYLEKVCIKMEKLIPGKSNLHLSTAATAIELSI